MSFWGAAAKVGAEALALGTGLAAFHLGAAQPEISQEEKAAYAKAYGHAMDDVFVPGQRVEYWSDTYQSWLETVILHVHSDGTVDVGSRPGVLRSKIRPCGSKGTQGKPSLVESRAVHIDKDGDRIAFAIEDGALIKYVNGGKKVGASTSSGVVTRLTCSYEKTFEKKIDVRDVCINLYDVRDQVGYGSDDFPESVVHSLKEMATVAKVDLEGNGWSHVGTQANRKAKDSGKPTASRKVSFEETVMIEKQSSDLADAKVESQTLQPKAKSTAKAKEKPRSKAKPKIKKPEPKSKAKAKAKAKARNSKTTVKAKVTPKTMDSYALVIGNNYPRERSPLHSCENDADAMCDALRYIGFKKVFVKKNLDLQSTKRALKELRDKAKEAVEKAKDGRGVLVLVYFSGHGISVGGENYLIPTKMPTDTTSEDFRDFAMPVVHIQTQLAQSGAKIKVLILDGCRDRSPSPLECVAHRDVKSTLFGGSPSAAKMSLVQVNQSEFGENTYIMQSCGEATKSYGGTSSELSVMTKHLVPLIKNKPGLSWPDLHTKLSNSVKAEKYIQLPNVNVQSPTEGVLYLGDP
jgi:hypothetical protein